MTEPVLWTLVFLQMLMGFFDVMYHHEFTERLAWRKTASHELLLHAVRNLFYAVLFVVFAWLEVKGIWAAIIAIVLITEVLITLWDFVEEDMSRKLPASERVTHTLLALNYGAILAYLLPVLYGWYWEVTQLTPVSYGYASYVLTFAAIGVLVFAIRDTLTSRRTASLELTRAETLVDGLPQNQKILVTGGTGFIGQRLIEALISAGHHVVLLTRSPEKAAVFGAPLAVISDLRQIDENTHFHAIIDLAGESVAGGLWTLKQKRKIIMSRVHMIRRIKALIQRLDTKPEVYINASATGWYGLRGDEVLTEGDPGKACFTHHVCRIREYEARKIETFGVRVVSLRIGLVLGHQGGVLGKLLPSYEFFAGGSIGNGMQWMPWIERDDLIRLIAHVVKTPDLQGAVNAVAPNPVRNKEFARALGQALGRPYFFRIPAWPLRKALGDFAEELFLRGQRVSPEKVMMSGFQFTYSTIERALEYCVGSGNTK